MEVKRFHLVSRITRRSFLTDFFYSSNAFRNNPWFEMYRTGNAWLCWPGSFCNKHF